MGKRRVTCPRCGAALPPAAPTGRPRVYCGPVCRRDAEYALRRLQGHLTTAERSLQSARFALELAEAFPYEMRLPTVGAATRRVKFWTDEVDRLAAGLRFALADLSEDEE